MSTRSDLPPNPEMDAKHEVYKQALIEYLTTHAGREERKSIVKEALKELWREGLVEFGWLSLKTVGLAGFIVFMYLYLYLNGWHK